MRFSVLAAALAAVLAISAARAANPDDLARTLDMGRFQACPSCDLTDHDFKYRFFHFANLYGIDGSGSNFYGADLAGAILLTAKLDRASFVYANLSGALMHDTSLAGADFSHAWLNNAQLYNAKLAGANFTDAHLRTTHFDGADLSQAIGLTQDQLDEACGNDLTQLPPRMRIPYC